MQNQNSFASKNPENQKNSEIHISVLPEEVLEMLDISHKNRLIDGTLGMAGHSILCLQKNPSLKILAFDQDANARAMAQKRLEDAGFLHQVEIVPQNFETIGDFASFQPDAILLDIGISSLHIDDAERGFSFRFDARLDMRMNQQEKISAFEIVNFSSATELEKILREYGEEPEWKSVAAAICEQRKKSPIETTKQLAECVESAKKWHFSRKKQGGGHPAVLAFQGIRIAVNRELEVLEKALSEAIKILPHNGRLAVISFHSLEDRLVKNCFREYKKKEKRQKYPKFSENLGMKKENEQANGEFFLEEIAPFPAVPSIPECEKNPRSRSAKLRVVEKKYLFLPPL